MGCKWSKEEIEKLIKNYKDMSMNQLYDLFDGKRSKNSIENKACELKLKKSKGNVREGFQICKKCKREFPWNFKYFPVISGESNPRRICRECNPKYGKFLNDDYKKRVIWSKEDEELFIKRYPHYTNEELRNLFYQDLTDKQLSEKAYKLRIIKSEETYWRGREQQAPKVSEKLKGRKLSEEHKRKVSETKKRQFAEGVYTSVLKGRIVSDEERKKMSERVKGKWSGIKNPRYKNPLFGKNNGRWQGGITAISTALRENIYDWKRESMELCDFKCVLSGGDFDNIHHLTPFNNIVKECINELKLDLKPNLGEYDEYTRNSLIKLIQEKHKIYGLGLCVNKDLHKLFHDLYSYSNFTVDDWKEFTNRYFRGEFDSKLKDELKSINSKTNYEEAMETASFYYVKN